MSIVWDSRITGASSLEMFIRNCFDSFLQDE